MGGMTTEEPGSLPTDAVTVRNLREGDLDPIVRIDAVAMGHPRRDFYKDRLRAALEESRIHLSLVAELDGMVAGFLMATLYYGELGRPEPTAVIDALGVHPEMRGRHVGEALMRQFLMNTGALGVEGIRTEVPWNDTTLVAFFDRHGFAPSGRIVLERSAG